MYKVKDSPEAAVSRAAMPGILSICPEKSAGFFTTEPNHFLLSTIFSANSHFPHQHLTRERPVHADFVFAAPRPGFGCTGYGHGKSHEGGDALSVKFAQISLP